MDGFKKMIDSTKYTTKIIDGEIMCVNGEFGTDPLPGSPKWCFCTNMME